MAETKSGREEWQIALLGSSSTVSLLVQFMEGLKGLHHVKQKKWIRLTLCHSPPLFLHYSICTHPSGTLYCDPNNRPPGSVALAEAKIAPFFPPFPRRSTVALLQTLSGLCQSNEQSLNCSMVRKQMQRWDNLQRRQRKGRREIRNTLSKCSSGRPKICLTVAHFSNLSLIELRFQTAGRLSG